MEESAFGLYRSEKLESNVRDLLISLGAADVIASDIAHSLIVMSLRGVDSHGVALLAGLLRRIQSGRCQITKPAEFVTETPSAGVVDAHLSPGQHACMAAVRRAVSRASEAGVYIATVKNSSHFGGCTPYLLYAVSSDMIAFVASNSAQSMAIYGADQPNMGNNPFGFGAPVEGSHPFIFDFSSAIMSFGTLAKYQTQKREVPEGAFFEPQALEESNVAYEIAGRLAKVALPFGGYKGASVGVMVEVLTGVLSGGAYGHTTELIDEDGHFHGPSHFVLVINPAIIFGESKLFKERMRELIADIRMKHAGKELRIPGDNASAVEIERLNKGVPLPLKLVSEVQEIAGELGAKFSVK